MILWDPANPEAALHHARAVHARSQAWSRAVSLVIGAAGRVVRRLSGQRRKPAPQVRRLRSPSAGAAFSIAHRPGDCPAC